MASTASGDRHHPKKSLGQNFLVDPNLQRRIVEALDPGTDDEVLEIGPGRGALTRHLVGRVGRLILVELDDMLAASLADEYASDPSVTLVHADFLQVDPAAVATDSSRLKVIGNIPYNITTPIIFHLLERSPRPALIVLMVQREVADRILAPPGGKIYGALAVGVQAIAQVERVTNVPRGAFRPIPDVDSTVVRITPLSPPPIAPGHEAAVRALTRMAFGQRRKQFQRILRDALSLPPERIKEVEGVTGFDLRHRPESFSPEQFVELAAVLASRGWLGPSGATNSTR